MRTAPAFLLGVAISAVILPKAISPAVLTETVVEVVDPDISDELNERYSVGIVGGCSGVVVDPSGVMLTAKHCELRGDVDVWLPEKKVKGRVAYTPPGVDGAVVVKLDPAGAPYRYVQMAERKPEPGDKAYAVGYPADGRGMRPYARYAGEVIKGKQYEDWFVNVTSVGADHGSSGGPLFNESGEVIGVCSQSVSSAPMLTEYVSWGLCMESLKSVGAEMSAQSTGYAIKKMDAGTHVVTVYSATYCAPCKQFAKDRAAGKFREINRLGVAFKVVTDEIPRHIKSVPAFEYKGKVHYPSPYDARGVADWIKSQITIGVENGGINVGVGGVVDIPVRRRPLNPKSVDWSQVTLIGYVPDNAPFPDSVIREYFEKAANSLTGGAAKLVLITGSHPARDSVMRAVGKPFSVVCLIGPGQDARTIGTLVGRKADQIYRTRNRPRVWVHEMGTSTHAAILEALGQLPDEPPIEGPHSEFVPQIQAAVDSRWLTLVIGVLAGLLADSYFRPKGKQ